MDLPWLDIIRNFSYSVIFLLYFILLYFILFIAELHSRYVGVRTVAFFPKCLFLTRQPPGGSGPPYSRGF
jgi:hypothetical protein